MSNAIVSLATDLLRGKQTFSYNEQTYDVAEAQEVLRQELLQASKKVSGQTVNATRKALRRHDTELFEIIEELVPIMIQEGFNGDEFWMNFVDERNIALGDKNEFIIPDNTTFIVTKIAEGLGTPDRQRLDHGRTINITTSKHGVRMYEAFARFIAGRIDWNALVEKVAKSFRQAIWNDIYTAFTGISASTVGLSETYVKAGTYDKAVLNTLIEHVEAATGESAVIIGTKTALAKCEGSEKADSAKESMHNAGFYGMFDGTPMVMLKQQHRAGTDEFILDDTTVYVVAGGDKFIKLVNEGDAYVEESDQTKYADQTLNYLMTMYWGVGIAIAGKIGKYTITGV